MNHEDAMRIVLEAAGEYEYVVTSGDIRDSEKNRSFSLEELGRALSVIHAREAQ